MLEDAAPATARKRIRGVALRLGWGLADQAVSSLTNFAMTIYVARTLGAVAFGAYSLAYVTYSLALNASRGLSTDPLMVRFSGAQTPAWRRAVASSSATAMTAGLASGFIVLAAAVLLMGTTRAAFLALGLVLPGLLLQDSWRYAFFAVGRGGQAFLNDSIWAVAMVPGLIYVRMTGHPSVSAFILIWGAAATVAAGVGPLQARVLPVRRESWDGCRAIVTSAPDTSRRTRVIAVRLSCAATAWASSSAWRRSATFRRSRP